MENPKDTRNHITVIGRYEHYTVKKKKKKDHRELKKKTNERKWLCNV